ncbi:DMT family transporter [Candidatus Fukatsuia endosymbiont of Tuberolachnus salignus]|uniref:DMT family transporter n=1 Tax=Candidatus Fukatsuia endosymbiont of Tuberolachnus salignus TaxID=3077957 RepID=UPI00313F1FCC
MKNSTRAGTYYGLLSGVLWGASGTLVGMVLIDKHLQNLLFAPIILAFISDFLSSGYMLFYLIKKKYPVKEALTERKALIISVAALCGGPIGMSCYFMAIKYIGVGYAATISASYPAFGALIAFLFLKDKLHKIGVLGLFLSIITTMTLGYGAATDSEFSLIGLLFALMCAVSWGLEVVISSYGMRKSISPDVAYFIRQISSSFGYVLLFASVIPFSDITEYYFMDLKIILQIVVVSLIATGSYLYYYRSINLVGPIRAMGLNITYAVWAVLFGWSISNNKLDAQLIILCCIIMIGSFLTVSNPKSLSILLRYNK